jgi:hypothetical protein
MNVYYEASEADRPDLQRQGISKLDQVPYGLPCPEGKQQLQLVGAATLDQGDDRVRPNLRQQIPRRTTPFAGLQYFPVPFSTCFEPLMNRGPTHTEHQIRLNHPLAKGLLYLLTQLSSIVRFHNLFTMDIQECSIYYAPVSKKERM